MMETTNQYNWKDLLTCVVRVNNPMDHATMIVLGDGGVEHHREVGWGRNRRTIYPDGKVIYLHPDPEKITEVKY